MYLSQEVDFLKKIKNKRNINKKKKTWNNEKSKQQKSSKLTVSGDIL